MFNHIARTVALAAVAATSLAAIAQTTPAPAITNTFVRIAPRVAGVLYKPAVASPRSHVAVVVMHDYSDFLDHPATVNLASRGYTVLAANPRYAPDVDDRDTDWDQGLQDLGQAMRYARALPGVDRVVLLGHSSGAPLASAYQNIAENGVKACQGPEKIVPCPSSLAGMPRADGVVLLDPIFGLGANVLTSVDPALAEGANEAALDMYAPANGFSTAGANYSDAFRKRFLQAQAARNADLINRALQRLEAVRAGKSIYADDEPFVVPGATRTPRLWRPALGLLSHTQGSYLLLKGDGTRSTEVIRTLRVPSGIAPAVPDRNDREAAAPARPASTPGGPVNVPTLRVKPLLAGGTLDTTVRRFLNTFASRATPEYDITEDSIRGIDWQSSYTSTPGNLQGVTAPFLVMGMTGHYWLVSAELAYKSVASADKSIAFVEGATHGFTPCQPCAKTPGQFGNTTATTFSYVADWLASHFPN
jgi:pimeloyl-ACP methyl ester carboxylesterase